MPVQLKLVKTLSRLREEQRHSDEIMLASAGLSIARGAVTEIAGGASTGKTSLAMSLLAKLTEAGEICACVDSADGFDPMTANMAGVKLDNLLWIKCGSDIERSFMAADYLVQAKGFGCVWLNLCGLSQDKLRMVPKTYWYRYRTRIKETPTVLLVTSKEAITGSASHQSLVFSRENTTWSGSGRFKLLREFHLAMQSKGFYTPAVKTRIEMDYRDL